MLITQDGKVSHRCFGDAARGTEHFFAIKAPDHLDFTEQLRFLSQRYQDAKRQLGLSDRDSVFRRIFLSDVLNQAAQVRDSDLVDEMTAVSVVQQAPLPASKVELLAYHITGADPILKRRLSARHLLVEKNQQQHLWSTRLCACDHETAISPEKQTREIFDDLIGALEGQGATLFHNCVRTWIYLKDVDVFYKGMVDERRALFTEAGLTGDTHYIASTGIEGACSHRYDLVAMDAYSNLTMVPGQMTYLNDFERLCATLNYNVTFERGTRIAYADRAHHFISGTASIDKYGEVVHPGHVMRQLEHALDNVEALLRSGGATLDDLMYMLVYLRDPSDYGRIDDYLRERFPDMPTIIVQGAVCRPAWLVEVEGVGVTTHSDPALPAF
jgi:enamine deaminase RidA (YjgF/YER057c/UK114 family)